MFRRSGSDLLSRALRQSTIGAKGFNSRVRNGIAWDTFAMTTGSSKHSRRNFFIQARTIKFIYTLKNQANRTISTG